nr:hypothetical protein [Helicobacter pullorum]
MNTLKNKYKLKTSAELNRAGYKQFDNNETVFMAKDNKQIKQIWDDITEGAEVLEEKPDRKGGYMIKRRKLQDGTIIQLRKKSRSEGSTIEIIKDKDNGKGKENTKIHNKAKEDGDW